VNKRGIILGLIFFLFPFQKASAEFLFASANIIDKVQLTEKKEIPEIQGEKYLLGPGDFLKLQVYSSPEFSGDFAILNDGTLSSLIFSDINLDGLTIKEGAELIEKQLKSELIDPTIELTLIKSRDLKILVIGEVERPGFYSFIGNNVELNKINNPTLIDAIQKANGLTDQANMQNITLIRKLSKQNDGFKQAELNLIALLKDGSQKNNPILFDGDTIKVKKINNNYGDQPNFSKSNLYTSEITVNVIGEVNSPGRIKLDRNSLLNEAILAAGGPVSNRANKNNIKLFRIEKNGSIEKRNYKFSFKNSKKASNNPTLQDGDTVLVGRSQLAIASDGIKTVADPITTIVTPWRIINLISD
tara:strand:- start:519 stop:1595 length:1077 start_codon:yes stop_codon:yes gene_type:complete